MKGQTIISAVGLTKVFLDFWRRARVRAVNDIDFTVESGEIFGLLGPNGSGKSTTIKMLLGLLYPTRGRITIFGKPPEDVATKSRIGYLPEESYSYKFLNARETLEYYGTLFQIPRRERKRRIEELLEMVGLRSAARRPVGEYSKGMARRIGLAQALINDPDLLILDEPTSGLDPIGSKLVKDIIVRLGQTYKKTILLSSHLLADVEEVCGRVAILFGGRIRVMGTMQEVLSRQDQMQITCDRLKPETVREIQEIIQRREGKQVEIATPKDRLESLFLRIVEEAHAARVETAGSQSVGEIAGFLGQDAGGRAVLDSLTREEPPATASVAAPAAAARVDSEIIQTLTTASGAAAAVEPAAPSRPEADRAVLDTLLNETQDKKSS